MPVGRKLRSTAFNIFSSIIKKGRGAEKSINEAKPKKNYKITRRMAKYLNIFKRGRGVVWKQQNH